MPISGVSSKSARLKLGLVMHLGEDVHAERLRGGGQLVRGRIIDRSHDDEDAVGAPGARLEHLIAIEHEVLAQHGQRRGRARRGEIFGSPLEGGRVGENREAGAPPSS